MPCVAVIPARRAEKTISATLASLRIGNDAFVAHVVVVTSAGDPTAGIVAAWQARDPRVHLLAAAEPLSAGAARNAGREFAERLFHRVPEGLRGEGSLLLFIDADCLLEAGGAARLAAERIDGNAAAVSARVLGCGGAVARARHILEFKEAASARIPPADWSPPTTTMVCSAAAFDRVGGFADLWPGEDLVFSQALRDCGELVLRSPSVTTMHVHPDGVVEMVRHQVRLGRTSAIARRTIPMPGSVFARNAYLAPLLFPGRIARIAAWQAREGGAELLRTLPLVPLLLAGLAGWTAGFVAGSRARPNAGAPRSARGATANPPHARRAGTAEHTLNAAPGPGGLRTVAVVPVFDGDAVLGECLDALLASGDGSLDIVVADDGSRDRSLAVARERAAASNGRIEVIALGANHGFAGAINRAVAHVLAREEPPGRLAFVNQDCFVARDWLAPLLEALDDPGVALAGARLLDADGITLQHAGARIEANGLTSHLGRGCRDQRAWRSSADVDYVCGALLGLRTQTWHQLGAFDEGYRPAYYEEVDYCRRAQRAGLRVVYVAGSEARHVEASCSGRDSRLFLGRYHRNRLRFVVRHQLRDVGVFAWLRAEAAWLLRLRRWQEVAPVLAAYAQVPRFVGERWTEAAARDRVVETGDSLRPAPRAAVRGINAIVAPGRIPPRAAETFATLEPSR